MSPFLLTLSLALAQTDPAAALAARVEARYRAARSVTLDFTERYTSKATGQVLVEKGRLRIAAPGRMRWDYTDPEEKVFVLDGTRSSFYVPADRVVYRSQLEPGEARRLPALFLAGKGDLLRDFEITLEEGPVLKLGPRRAGEQYEEARLEVDAESAAIRALSFRDALGNVTAFEFRNETAGAAFPAEVFVLELPRDVEVVETAPSESR